MNQSSSRKLHLMSRLGVAFLTWRRYLQRQLLPHGITLKQQHVLRQLDRRRHLYPADIAEILFCDRPTATVILDNLEKQGWVRREKDPENRKFVRVYLTSPGKNKFEELETKLRIEFDPLACFTPEEIDQLDTLLVKLCHHLKQIEAVSDQEE